MPDEHLPTAAVMACLACARASLAMWWIGAWLVSEAVAGEA